MIGAVKFRRAIPTTTSGHNGYSFKFLIAGSIVKKEELNVYLSW
jgi:hypothetical protein